MFNKRIKKELETVKTELAQVRAENVELQKFLAAFRSTKQAKRLLEDARKEDSSISAINRIKFLEQSIDDFNYRNYITKTRSGRICIDIYQIPLSDEDIQKLLK